MSHQKASRPVVTSNNTATLRVSSNTTEVLTPVVASHTATTSNTTASNRRTTFEVSSRTTEVLTLCNGALLLTMTVVVLKVLMAPAEAMSEEQAVEDMSITRALPSVLVWGSLGVCLICFNKYMYMPVEKGGFGFPCPMSLTWWHMVTALIATNIVRVVRPPLMPAACEGSLGLRTYLTSVVPVGIVFGAYLAIGNTVYLYLPISFIQMLKSSGPLFVFAVSAACGLEKVTLASILAVAVVFMGVAGATAGELAFSWFGFALQAVAFILDGIRMVLFKFLMSSRGTKLDPLSALYYYAPVCVISLLVPVIHYEGHQVVTILRNAPPSLFGMIALNGLVAFALNISLLSLVKNTSPTTISMASAIRDVVLTFGTAALFHSSITRVQLFGYLSACLGIKLWDEVKARPDAFYKAFAINTSEQFTIVRKAGIPL